MFLPFWTRRSLKAFSVLHWRLFGFEVSRLWTTFAAIFEHTNTYKIHTNTGCTVDSVVSVKLVVWNVHICSLPWNGYTQGDHGRAMLYRVLQYIGIMVRWVVSIKQKVQKIVVKSAFLTPQVALIFWKKVHSTSLPLSHGEASSKGSHAWPWWSRPLGSCVVLGSLQEWVCSFVV